MRIPTSIEETLDREYVMMRLLSSCSPDFITSLKEVINRFGHLKSMILLPETLLFLPTTSSRTRTKNVYMIEFQVHKFTVKVQFKVVPYTTISKGWSWHHKSMKLTTPEQIYEHDHTDIVIFSGKDHVAMADVFPGSLIVFDRARAKFTKTDDMIRQYYSDDQRAQRMSALFYDPDDAIQYMSEGMMYLKEKNFLPNLKTR